MGNFCLLAALHMYPYSTANSAIIYVESLSYYTAYAIIL